MTQRLSRLATMTRNTYRLLNMVVVASCCLVFFLRSQTNIKAGFGMANIKLKILKICGLCLEVDLVPGNTQIQPRSVVKYPPLC